LGAGCPRERIAQFGTVELVQQRDVVIPAELCRAALHKWTVGKAAANATNCRTSAEDRAAVDGPAEADEFDGDEVHEEDLDDQVVDDERKSST
jgi:hypothetical protein